MKHLWQYGVLPWASKAMAVICLFAMPVQAEDRVTVLALGDSLTQGYGLIEEAGLVPQLQGWLDEQGANVALVNGGVSGDTTAGAAARVGWSLTEDVDAMIVTLGGNDFLRGIAPEVSRANIDAILTTAADAGVEVLLVGMRAPGNFGPDYQVAFDAIYPELAEAHRVLLHPWFFSGLGEGTPEDWQPYFQSDRIHPNAEGVQKIVEGLGPSVLTLIGRVE